MAGEIYIGTSGYNHKDWRRKFYPRGLDEKRWLSFYGEKLNLIEMSVTFYREVEKSEYQRWYRDTGDRFRFSIKGPQVITQMKNLRNVDDDVQAFFIKADELKEKLAVVLWQFPPNFTLKTASAPEHRRRLRYFLSIIPKTIRHAFEFRGESWFTDEIRRLLDRYNAAFVMSDGVSFPTADIANDTFSYIRLHGPDNGADSGYTREQLQTWAQRILSLEEDHDVYCVFNNVDNAHAVENAAMLKELLQLALAPG